VAALLLTIVLSTALGGVAMIAAIERRTAAAHATSLQLRLTAQSAAAMAAGELGAIGFDAALQGASSAWRVPLSQPLDLDGLSAGLRREAMMQSSHGADTPVWRLFAHAPWLAVSGLPGPGQAVMWVADDWAEGDGDPLRDGNGLVLVRAAAFAGRAAAWTEALCGRDAGGRVDVRHVRSW
jgi:hypothetical protein